MPKVEIGSIAMQLNRKAIKNLHISVLPPDGRVRVSAPESMTETAIRMAVISRIPWIKKQQSDFAKQPRQSDREMVSGECHYLWGRRYRLNVVERAGKHEIKLGRGRLHLYVNPATTLENKALVLSSYYRDELKARIAELLPIWEDKIGVIAADWGVKKMKTKWGSCNIQAKRIWLNLELAKKPPECLEYILVHELVHLLERNHNERFKGYMDKLLPDWRERRDLLNRMPLAHNNWIY
ncbi:M48 family metallopeptidase [Vibrio cholerae]|jgi:predicted metal-dependent hydrolase|uniref:M48 family metallopeptidase n=1 Tax=Vibrio TaxID=662 RepID=UPI001EDE0162|nr:MULTISPECIES: SprT family zinc-dependent metalloprotease [Vibrio]EKO3687467.1 M48 family metallopeptidase [Vibrio metschnikovii]EKO3690897.1 M48 family metallopeptidase [Vibrio metschnikovii]MCG3759502.1 M48 family peptidase [Vibrio cincinnatiensis]MCG3762802.1 M48 family peptidase [Vibrio cincinnatiensis]MCU4202784.1 M48 family metallopeptidase [Vibrio cholerae]